MNLIYLLHFYQPDFQFRQVLEDVYYNSYKKIFESIAKADNAKIVINITASTIEILNNYGIGSIIEDLKDLYKMGKVEFTATSLAHVLLSHSTLEQALRQVKLDIEKKAYYLDIPKDQFKILFPPELSVNDQVLEVANAIGLEGLIASHSSVNNFEENNNRFQKKNLKIFIRSLKLSRMFESPEVTSMEKLHELMINENLDSNGFYVVAHDAEILGRQNPKKVEMFSEILNDPKIKFTTFAAELKNDHFKNIKGEIKPGTWEKLPIEEKWLDVHWKNPKNKIHTAQWKFSELIVKTIEAFPDINKKLDLQTHLDYCQYSCQYWWASSYPFWSPGIVSHSAWTWLYLAYRVYNELKPIDKAGAELFKKRIDKLYMQVITNLTNYDITKWHEKNIHYYDQFIHPLKLKFKL